MLMEITMGFVMDFRLEMLKQKELLMEKYWGK